MIGNVAGALRQVLPGTAFCVACERAPERIKVTVDVTEGVTVGVRCHGSVDRFHLTEEEVDDGQIGKAIDWAKNLFPLDGFPDMRELLKYNREPWLTS